MLQATLCFLALSCLTKLPWFSGFERTWLRASPSLPWWCRKATVVPVVGPHTEWVIALSNVLSDVNVDVLETIKLFVSFFLFLSNGTFAFHCSTNHKLHPHIPQFSGQAIIEHLEFKTFPSTTPVSIDAAPVGWGKLRVSTLAQSRFLCPQCFHVSRCDICSKRLLRRTGADGRAGQRESRL